MKKIFRLLTIFISSLLFFSSCDSMTGSSSRAGGFNQDGSVTFEFSVNSSVGARTALPSVDLNDLTYKLISLEKKSDGTTEEKTVFEKKVYNEIKDGSSITLKPANYRFTMIGYFNDVPSVEGMVDVDLTNGHREANFRMYPCQGGKGSAEIVCIFPDDGVIQSAKGFWTDDVTNPAGVLSSQDLVITKEDNPTYGKIRKCTLSFSNLDSGTKQYGVVIFYDQAGNHVFSYAEGIIVVTGFTSRSIYVLDEEDYLSETVLVNLKRNDAAWKNSGKTISLRNGTKKYVLKEFEGCYTASVLDGTYDVFINDLDTEIDFDTTLSKSCDLKYYDVTLEACAGTTLTTVEVNPVYDGKAFNYIPAFEKGYKEGAGFAVTANGSAIVPTPVMGATNTLTISKQTVIRTENASLALYTASFEKDEGDVWILGSAPSDIKFTVKDSVELYGKEVIKKSGFIFKGWKVDGSEDAITRITPGMFDSDVTLKPVWEDAGNSEYKLKYYYQEINTDFFKQDTSVEITVSAHVDDVITSEDIINAGKVPEKEGFTVNVSPEKISVAADGSSCFMIEYTRKKTTLKFITGGTNGSFADGSNEKTVTGKYGADVLIEDPVGKAGYVFGGWKLSGGENVITNITTFPAEGKTYEAIWTNTTKEYVIKYAFQDFLDTENYVVDENYTVNGVGNKGHQIIPREIVVAGFEVDGTIDDYKFTLPTKDEINSIEVTVKYNRKLITINYDGNQGTWNLDLSKDVSGLYGTKVPDWNVNPGKPEREGYEFIGWNPSVPSYFPTEDETLYAQWKQTAADYTIKYYYQNIDDDDYTEDLGSRRIENGTLDVTTNVTATNVPGFKTPVITQTVIKEDDSDVVTVKYERLSYSYTFNPNGGDWGDGKGSSSKVVTGKFEQTVVAPSTENLTRSEYEFTGWNPVTLPLKFGDASDGAEFMAQWNQLTSTYTVKYFYEKIDSEEYEEAAAESQTLKGTIGDTTNVVPSSKVGFDVLPVEQKTITSDGNTVVEVKYKRKIVTVKFNPDGGKWTSGAGASSGNSMLPYSVTGKYGETVSEPGVVEKENYLFKEWNPAVPQTFPESDVTVSAVWTLNEVNYTVKYYFQNIQDDDYTYDPNMDEEKKGVIGQKTEAGPLSLEKSKQKVDFEKAYVFNPVISQQTITRDGKAEVNVYYDRKVYTYNFDPTGGFWGDADGSKVKKVSGKYGATVVVPSTASLTRSGFKYNGWSSNPPKTFGEVETDKTFGAVWGTDVVVDGFEIFTDKGDINLKASASVGSYIFAVEVPSVEGQWTFTWFIDGKKVSGSTASIRKTVEELGKGTHTIQVSALLKYTGSNFEAARETQNALYTKAVTITVN